MTDTIAVENEGSGRSSSPRKLALLTGPPTGRWRKVARALHSHGVNLIVSGETLAEVIRRDGIPVSSTEALLGPEPMEYEPKGGITTVLYRGIYSYDHRTELGQVVRMALPQLDFLFCELFPIPSYQETTESYTFDIGGVTLLRAAANRALQSNLVVLSEFNDIDSFINELETIPVGGSLIPHQREDWAQSAIRLAHNYEKQVDMIFDQLSGLQSKNITSKFSIPAPQKPSDTDEFIPLPEEFLNAKWVTKTKERKRENDRTTNPVYLREHTQKKMKRHSNLAPKDDSNSDSEDSVTSEPETPSENIMHTAMLGTGSFCPSDKREFIKDMLTRCQVIPVTSSLFNGPEKDLKTPDNLLAYAKVIKEFYATDSSSTDELITRLITSQQPFHTKDSEVSSVWEMTRTFLNALHRTCAPSSEGPIPRNFFTSHYTSSPPENSLPFVHALRTSSLTILEQSYRNFIEEVVALEVTLDTTSVEKLDIFVPKASSISKDNGEAFNREYFWATLFYMFRGGYYTELRQYITSNLPNVLSGDRELLNHLLTFIDNQNQKLPDDVILALARDTRRLMDVFLGNPNRYQMALIKIIGGLEPKSINIPGVLLTVEDFLWAQLHMSREKAASTEAADQSYTSDYSFGSLNDSQPLGAPGPSSGTTTASDPVAWNWECMKKMMVTLGPESFVSSSSHPSDYFKLLLLTGQFEMAVAFLTEFPSMEIEALHLAIAFIYYGVLRVSKKVKLLLTREICSTTDHQGKLYSTIHFSNLILMTAKKFHHDDLLEFVPYLCLMSGLPQKSYLEKSHLYFQKLTLETRKYTEILGYLQPDGKLTPGLLDTHHHHLHIDNLSSFRKTLVKLATAQEVTDGSLEAAERLFSLIEDYDSSVHILNKQLSDLLFPFSLCSPSNMSLGFKQDFTEQVDAIHRRLLFYYHIDRTHIKETTRHVNATLMEMLDFLRDYFNGNDRARIDVLNLFLIPHSVDHHHVQAKAQALATFPSWVQRCLPHVLRHALDFITSEVGDPYHPHQPEDAELLAKARALQNLSIGAHTHSLALHLPPTLTGNCPL